MSVFIHPTSIIDDGATIGEGTKVWHFCHIMPEARIGEKCILGQNVFVGQNVVIGSRVKIQNNVSVYEGVVLKNEVFVGPSVVFTNVINPRSSIERKTDFKKTIVETGASIGANSTIICGITIGKFAFIGAGAVVTKDVPDYTLVTGNPARQTGWMSEAGEKLIFDEKGEAVCAKSSEIYLLRGNGVTKKN